MAHATIQVEYSYSEQFRSALLIADGQPDEQQARASIYHGDRLAADHQMWFDPQGLHCETRVYATQFAQLYRNDDIWRGDCLQMGIDPAFARTVGSLGESTVLLGFTRVDGKPYAHAWKWGSERPTGAADLPFEFSIGADAQVYRVCLPWSALPPFSNEHGDSLGYSLSVNGHDAGQPCYDTWGGGIINGQDASKFGVAILDRHNRGIGAEVVNREPANSYDPADTVRLDVLVPMVTQRVTSVELSVSLAGHEVITGHRQPVKPGENRLAIALPVEMLADGANEVSVRLVAQPSDQVILSRSLPVVRETVNMSVARILCDRVDWARPELAGTDFAAAYRAGRVEEAALGFVHYLRQRPTPHMGYTKEYVAKLRTAATPECRQHAADEIATLLKAGFLGGSYPDGRGTLLSVRPEVLQVAATRADIALFAQNLTASWRMWNRAGNHTSVNVLRYLQAVWPLEECTDESLVPVLAFLNVTQQTQWVGAKTWDDVSIGTTGHNWWAYEFSGAWKSSLLFPEFKGFAQFRAFFPDFFEREIRLLFYPDGFTRECSVAYHIGTVDVFFDIARLAELNGLYLSPAFYDRLHAAAEVEWKLMQPDGNYPAFGDCFDKGPHVLERARSMAAMGAIPECKFLAESLDSARKSPFGAMLVESLNYPSIGEDLRPAYDRLPARAPATRDTALTNSGYYVMRQNWTATADYAAIEASARGMIDSSHGHSAIFDLKLCARGRAILVGNGKGPDDSGTPPRRWRVSNAAHSTASVDGQDHAPLTAIYRFARVVTPVVLDWVSTDDYAYFHGVHEAYNFLPSAVPGAHRELFYLRSKYWILIDRFVAASPDAPHTYQQHFQVVGPSRLEADGRCITEGAGGNLLFIPVAGATGVAAKTPCPFPLEDYPNPDQLSYTQQRNGNGLIITLLAPFTDAAAPKVSVKQLEVHADGRTLSPFEATGLEIQFGAERHVFVDLHTHWILPWECGGYRGEQALFHSAVGKGAGSAGVVP